MRIQNVFGEILLSKGLKNSNMFLKSPDNFEYTTYEFLPIMSGSIADPLLKG